MLLTTLPAIGDVANCVQVVPPSVDSAPTVVDVVTLLTVVLVRPTRATMLGASSAKSMLSVLVSTGLLNMPPAGVASTSS